VSHGNAQVKSMYPHQWTYVVIGLSEEGVRMAIDEVLQERTYEVAFSKVSAKGKYVSLRVTLIVNDEDDRGEVYQSLNDHPATKIVI
jgi:uncharacterized protein